MNDLENQIPVVEVDVTIDSESEHELTTHESSDIQLDLEIFDFNSTLDVLRFPYFCSICLSQYEINDNEGNPFTLSCGHTFCKSCLFRFLESKILDGEISPSCFKVINLVNPLNDKQITEEISQDIVSISIQPQSDKEDQLSTIINKNQINDEITNTSANESNEISIDNSYHIDVKNDEDQYKKEDEKEQEQLNEFKTTKECGCLFSQDDIFILIQHDKKLTNQYKRFKFFQDHKNGRECPNLSCGELLLGLQENPAMICTKCQSSFCFHHSLAHPSSVTCEEYVKSQAGETALNDEYLAKTTKPCPNCGNLITKISGCNHMKCRCGTAFCWICGKAVADETFPVHFQWWNINGCTNMQMVNDLSISPPRHIVYFARIRSFIELIIFGPITLLSAFLSILFCPCCVFRNKKRSFAETLGGLMTWWGMVYMILLIGLPVGVVLGSILMIWIIIYSIGYILYRLLNKKYPWPDIWGENVMIFLRRLQEPIPPPTTTSTPIPFSVPPTSRQYPYNHNTNNINSDSNTSLSPRQQKRQRQRHKKHQQHQQQQQLSVSITIPPPIPTTVAIYSTTKEDEEGHDEFRVDKKNMEKAATTSAATSAAAGAAVLQKGSIDMLEMNDGDALEEDGNDNNDNHIDDDDDDDEKNNSNNNKSKLSSIKRQPRRQQQHAMMMASADSGDDFFLSYLFHHEQDHNDYHDDYHHNRYNNNSNNIHNHYDDTATVDDAHILTESKAAGSSLPVTLARVISDRVLLTISEEKKHDDDYDDDDDYDVENGRRRSHRFYRISEEKFS